MTKLISRKQILDTGYFTVNEDRVELKNGETRKYFSAIRVPAVSVFPVGENDEIYLIKEYRYIYENYIKEAVAGIIEKNENPLETAKRELMEEAGIEAKEWQDAGDMVAGGSFITWRQHLFIAKKLTFKEQHLDASEDIELYKISLAEAVGKVLSGEINNGATAFGILLIDKLKKEGKI